MEGDFKFNRHSDIENLNRIPEIAAGVKYLTEKVNEMNESIVDYSETKTNVKWLLKTYWIIVTASLGAMVTAGIAIIIKLGR